MLKKAPATIFVASLLLLLASLGVCYGGVEFVCAPNRNEDLAVFVILFSISTGLSSIPLIFTSPVVFSSWFRFAKYYLPIAALLVIVSPSIDRSILGFDREFMTWLLSGIFLVVSLILIIYKQIRVRANKIGL